MAPGVLRSKSAPTSKPLSAHFLPKNVSFSSINAPGRSSMDAHLSETKHHLFFDSPSDHHRSPFDSPLTQRVEAFNLSGGFFPSQADEYDWVSADDETMGSFSKARSMLSSGLHTPAPSDSPMSAFSSLPATPGAELSRPLPDELDFMATEAINSEDKMGVLKITARSLSTFILGSDSGRVQAELSTDAEPLSDEALYYSLRARRQEATTPALEQPKYGELFLNSDSVENATQSRSWLDRSAHQSPLANPGPSLIFRADPATTPSTLAPLLSSTRISRYEYEVDMKLDATDLRYITNDEFRVLTSIEMGSKNHEVVPSSLAAQISGLRNGGVNKLLGQLAKRNLIARVQNTKYDGYRLTYGGYDYLALRAFTKRDTIYSVGNQIGVGKESDIYVVADSEGSQMVLKMHRLGRVSFRAIKEKRDYMGKRKSASWMYMSRLAAKKEWEFMKVLHEHGFPVPRPIDQARHCILMELIDAFPLRQISSHPNPGSLYSTLMDLIVRFAKAGLIHGDYNEFNILIQRETGVPVVIDFPQMVSTRHANAEWYFNRDVECIRRFFKRRFNYESAVYPRFSKTIAPGEGSDEQGFRLDVVVAASGFGGKEMKILDEYIASRLEDEGESDSDESGTESQDSDSGDESPEFRQVRPAAQEYTTRQERRNILENPLSDDGEDEQNAERSPSPVLTLPISSMRIQEKNEDALERRTHKTEFEEGVGGTNSKSPDIQDDDGSSDGEDNDNQPPSNSTVRDLVASTLEKDRKRNAKHHNKRGTTRVGRAKGHKGKMNARIKADGAGGWD